MPRYIDVDNYLKELGVQICNHCIDEDAHCCSCGVGEARGIAQDLSTADVVPRERYNRAMDGLKAVLEERAEDKAEFAREIFEEIEKRLLNHVADYYGCYHKTFDELKKKYTVVTDTNDGHKTQEENRS